MGLISVFCRSSRSVAVGAGIVAITLALILVGCGGSSQTASGGAGGGTQTTATQAAGSSSVTSVTAPPSGGAGGTTVQEGGETATTFVGAKSEEEYKQAIPQLEEKLKQTPDDLEALQELAIAQYNTKQYEAAAQTYQKMLQVKDDPFTRNNYANVLRDWGKTDEAKAEYQKAIAADPKLTVAYINLATVLVREDKKDEAIKILDQGIAQAEGEGLERLQAYKVQLSKAE